MDDKKRAMAVVQTLPYRYTLNKRRVAIIEYTVYWLNKIPKEEQHNSPEELILGEQKLDFKNIYQIL